MMLVPSLVAFQEMRTFQIIRLLLLWFPVFQRRQMLGCRGRLLNGAGVDSVITGGAAWRYAKTEKARTHPEHLQCWRVAAFSSGNGVIKLDCTVTSLPLLLCSLDPSARSRELRSIRSRLWSAVAKLAGLSNARSSGAVLALLERFFSLGIPGRSRTRKLRFLVALRGQAGGCRPRT